MHIADWSRFQGYKKRGPDWIKLHLSLLDQPQYLALPVVAQAVLPALWLTAARISEEGELPDDLALLSVLSHRPEALLREALPSLVERGWIVCDGVVARPATVVSGEERREEQRRERENNGVASLAPLADKPTAAEPEPLNGNGAGRGIKPEDRPSYADACWEEFRQRFSIQRLTVSSVEGVLVQRWMEQGIPLAVVLRGIGETGGAPRNLTACERPVQRCIEDWYSKAGLIAGGAA